MADETSNPPSVPTIQRPPRLKLWMVPAFGLVSAPLAFVLAVSSHGLFGQRLLDGFFILGGLSPVLGLVTLAILLEQYLMVPDHLHDVRMRRRATRLAVLALVSPIWLSVMFFAFAVFHR